MKIAIFPIPNCVTFPGTVFPLHVFEPRYRQMVRYCLETETLLAITHTKKVLSEAKPNQTREQALQSNQASYIHHTVFSAGKCQLLEELNDGRLFLQVDLQARFKQIHLEQRLPFILSICEEFHDLPMDEADEKQVKQLRDKILARLRVMTSQASELHSLLTSSEWESKTIEDFSFSIFSLLQFNPDQQQSVLEMSSSFQRLSYLLNLLNQ